MYPISSAAKALFDKEYRQLIRITGRDKNGTAINITEANVMQGGFSIDRYSCNNTKLEIGTAIASELTLKLDNRLGQFDNIYFEGAELFVEIGVAQWDADLQNWTTNSGQTVTNNNGQVMQFNVSTAVYWIPCGYFVPDEQPRRLSTITIHALDRMTRFDIVQHALLPWTDNYGNVITDEDGESIYFCVEMAFPATIKSIIEQACMICHVNLATDLTTLPGYDYVVAAMPEMQTTVTFRNLIQWCAGIMASNAWIDWNGDLQFSWYNNNTGYVTDLTNRFSSDVYENSIAITGVQFTDTDEDKTLYLAGSDSYTLDLTGNALIDGSTAANVLSGVYNIVHNYAYRPFSASVVTAPYLWPMDRVVYKDKSGDSYVSTLTNVNFTINGTTTIQAIGETTQTNSYASPSGFTSLQASILQKMRRVTNTDLNDAIDKATSLIIGADGGFVRFIYDENDSLTEIVIMDTDDISTATKVWRWNSGGLGYSSNGYAGPYSLAMTQDGSIVADFITSGTMSANVIRAGILTDTDGYNYWDLDNGIFRLAGNTTLDGKPVTQLVSEVNATISSVDVEFAQNQSNTVAPTEGWSTTAPAWADGYYIWQRTKTVSPSGPSYSEPTCISGRDGSASTPGLNQATVYLYQRAATQPAKPNVQTTYVFLSGVLSPIPDGWTRSVPNGSDPCWITSAQAISTETMDTIPANEWLTPTKFVENGSDGSSIDTITEYYAISNTTTPPDDSAFWTPDVPVEWTDNYGNVIKSSSGETIDFVPPAIPTPTKVDQYVWQYQLTTYTDGTSTKSNKYISSVLGATGVGVSEIIEQYYLSTSNTTQMGGEWSEEQPAWSDGMYIWTRTVVTWTDGEVTTTVPVLAKAINGANVAANDATNLANTAINNTNSLDASLNQTGVFNRLTNNGQVQGIYLENNQLYMNATYIKTGVIDAARIATGSLSITKLDTSAQSAIVTGVTTKTQYYLSTSNVEVTGDEWSDTMPSWVSGKYIWTRTVTTKNYADGTTSSTNSTAIYDSNLTTALSAANNAQSTADGAVGGVSAKTRYYLSTSSVSATGGTWQDTVPVWSAGKYVWTRTATTITPVVGASSTSYSTAVYDANLTNALSTASTAQQTANNALASTTVKMRYYLSSSDTSVTGGTWQDTIPTWSSGKYVWTRVATTKTTSAGTSTTTYSTAVCDSNLTNALSTANSAVTAANSAALSTVSVYYRSTTNTTPTIDASTTIGTSADTNNVWTYVMPQPKNGCYFFTCEKYTYVGGGAGFSAVRSIANANYTSKWCSANDATYIDGAHIYAGSVTAAQIATGTITIQNFSADAKGSIVASSTSKTEYYLSTSSASAVGGDWSENVPEWTNGKYVWTRTVTTNTFADGTVVPSTSTAVYDYNLTYALDTSASAVSDAADAQSTANSSVYRQQTIYKSVASGTPTLPTYTTWVTDATGAQNQWTQKRPVYNSSYPVLYVAVQKQTMVQSSGSTCSCTAPVIDQTTTVIDGGHITTGTIDAGVVNVTNINASNITSGNMSANYITTGTLDAANVNITHINASNITTGTLSADRVAAGAISASKLTVEATLLYRNLFIQTEAVDGYLSSDASSITSSSAYRTSGFIDVSNLNSIRVQLWFDSASVISLYYSFYTSNSMSSSVDGRHSASTTARTHYSTSISVPSTAKYLRVSYRGAGTANIKVETGDSYTDWSPAPEDNADVYDLSISGRTVINGGNITTGTIDASVVNVTNINASNIKTGTLDASVVNVANLSANNISAGTLNTSNITIQSNNSTTTGWMKLQGNVFSGGFSDTTINANITIGTSYDNGIRAAGIDIYGKSLSLRTGATGSEGRMTVDCIGDYMQIRNSNILFLTTDHLYLDIPTISIRYNDVPYTGFTGTLNIDGTNLTFVRGLLVT